jgi:nitrite reductase (NADH) large subunit
LKVTVLEQGSRLLSRQIDSRCSAAAVNALGGDMILTCQTPPTILKGVDLDLFSVGAVEPAPSDEVIVVDRPASYRRLVLSDGRAVAATVTVLGHHPSDVAAVQKAVRSHKTLGAAERAELRSRYRSVLADPTC